jgi:hypothetical protein
MKHSAIASLVLAACATAAPLPPRAVPIALPPKRVEIYRPGWTAGLSMQIEEILACTNEQEPPVQVLDVQLLAGGATGVMVADGRGQVERCAVQQGSVLVREPATLAPTDLQGRPMFAPGRSLPSVPVGILLEEVTSDQDEVLGWLRAVDGYACFGVIYRLNDI